MPRNVRKAAYVLPMVETSKGVMVLLGQERYHRRWSGFGGGLEGRETPAEAAGREVWEESLGYLGRPKDVQNRLAPMGEIKDTGHTYFTLTLSRYDPYLPDYYARTYDFIQTCGQKKLSRHCSEKIQVGWVNWNDLKHAVLNSRRYLSKTMILDKCFFSELDQLLKAGSLK